MNLFNEKINQARESIRDYLLFLLTFITVAERLDTRLRISQKRQLEK